MGRHKIAQRIAHGCRTLWPAAWMVLTFRKDIDKKAAVRQMGTFIRWLRTTPGNAHLEYVATYELTKRGRLHINLIVAPWTSVYQRVLARQWGARLWVEWVKDDQGMGVEAAAAYNPDALGGYLSKIEQAVPDDRRVSYSKGWPKLPVEPPTEHPVTYEYLDDHRQLTLRGFIARGLVVQVEPGIYELARDARDFTTCACFAHPKPGPVLTDHHPPDSSGPAHRGY